MCGRTERVDVIDDEVCCGLVDVFQSAADDRGVREVKEGEVEAVTARVAGRAAYVEGESAANRASRRRRIWHRRFAACADQDGGREEKRGSVSHMQASGRGDSRESSVLRGRTARFADSFSG